ncbi:unnamed protein product, partial [Ectocarpus sp. 12 AP-2014]
PTPVRQRGSGAAGCVRPHISHWESFAVGVKSPGELNSARQMDEYSEFASDDFDVKGWINATAASHLQLQRQAAGEAGAGSNGSLSAEHVRLSSPSAHSSLDTHLSTVATKLQAVSA